MKKYKKGSATIVLIIVILIASIGYMYYKQSVPSEQVEDGSQNNTESSTNLKVWKNNKLGYQFAYPADTKVVYSEATPDGACTFVNKLGKNSTTTISFIDNTAIAKNPDSENILCLPTDAPFGIKSTEPIHITALNKSIKAECSTAYFHKESFDANFNNDTFQGKLLYDVKSDSIYNKRCYYAIGGNSPIRGIYEIYVDYGKSIPINEAETMSDIARNIISSFSPVK